MTINKGDYTGLSGALETEASVIGLTITDVSVSFVLEGNLIRKQIWIFTELAGCNPLMFFEGLVKIYRIIKSAL